MVSMATSEPNTRPVSPRTISATSGFRFCGMMEEPEVNSSSSWIKENSEEDQITTSSAKRERLVMTMAQALKNSTTTSRLEVASIEFSLKFPNLSDRATNQRSSGKEVPAKAALPSGK